MVKGLPRVGIFHLGLQHAWQTALAFQQAGNLAWFATSIFYDGGRWPYKLETYLPQRLRERVAPELRRRSSPLIDPNKLRLFGDTEWANVLLWRANLVSRGIRAFPEFSRSRFQRRVIRLIEKEPVDVVWGFNGFARDVFQWAKRRGIRCILDQTIGHCRTLNQTMSAEREKYPEFFPSEYSPYSDEFIEYQEEELALADLIVVGSRFAAETLMAWGVAPDKLYVLPYGYEETEFTEPMVRRYSTRRPLEFLFIGQINPRKGVQYLLKSFAQIPRSLARLKLIGSVMMPSETLARYSDHIEVVRHIPRLQVPSAMRSADCFIFPSLFEGSALVLYEARGSGMGRVYTPMAGHSDPLDQGAFLSTVSVEYLIELILALADDPTRIEAWSEATIEHRHGATWSAYRTNAVRLLHQLLRWYPEEPSLHLGSVVTNGTK